MPNNKSCNSWFIPTMELIWNVFTRQRKKSTNSCIRKRFSGDNDLELYGSQLMTKIPYFSTSVQANEDKKNQVEGLVNSDGLWQMEETKVAKMAIDYYQTLFTASATIHMAEVVDKVDRVVTDDMRRTLMLPYTEEEVRVTLFQMHPSKSPDLDGMSLYFF